MSKARIRLVQSLLVACLIFVIPNARAQPLTLSDVVKLATEHSPQLSAARFREVEAQEGMGISRAGYLPVIEFQAIDSTGFPGSSGLTGVSGLMGSSYRSGPGYGLVARQNIWDFGRTSNGLAAARGEANLRKEDTQVTLYQVKQAAVRAFVDCSRFKTLMALWLDLSKESQLVAKEVRRYVKTGQRSLVELSLVESQTEEALTAAADFSERMKAAVRRISILTAVPDERIACAPLKAEELVSPDAGNPASSPVVTRAAADVEVAQARARQAKAGHWPRLIGVASVGDDAKARLVNKQDYALAIGFIFPLFDGLRTTSEVRRAEAASSEKERELEAARERVLELNAAFDEALQSSTVRKEHLQRELALTTDALVLARKRYFSQQGSLVDFRESLRNVSRVRTQLVDAQAEAAAASWSKALLNGSGG